MTSDRAFAAAALAASGGYLAAGLTISAPAGGYDLVGPRTFPLAIGAGPGRLGALDRVPPRTPGRPGGDRLAGGGAQRPRLSRLPGVPRAARLPPLATTGFIVAESRALGSRAWRRDLAAGVVIAGAAYLGFRLLLGIRLPAGPFG